MKIALLSDLHLSDLTPTPQEEALDWAIKELSAVQPDACVWLGDLTACGSRFMATLAGAFARKRPINPLSFYHALFPIARKFHKKGI